MNEVIVVLAISLKKERGWIKCAPAFKNSWGDLGMHFDKAQFGGIFIAPGLYEVSVVNNASFGANPAYEVSEAKKIGTFEELAAKKEK